MRHVENVRITHLGQHGDGVADGPIYAPLTAPGDIVSGSLQEDTLHNVRIQEPSDLRVKAPCRHFKSCGGCNLQHVHDATVADWKADVVRTALAQRHLETAIRPTVTSPPRSRRRAVFALRRTKSGGLVGFHAKSSDTVIPVSFCEVLTPSLNNSIEPLKQMAMMGASRRSGLDVAVTETVNGLDLAVTGGKDLDPHLQSELATLAEANHWTRITWNTETAAQRLPSDVAFDGLHVPLPPGAFLQATKHGEETLRSLVQSHISERHRIADLFAGCGTFALPFAKQAEVVAYEGDRDMIAALQQGWRHATGVKKLTGYVRDLFKDPVTAVELAKTDAIVIDPPRAGAAGQIPELAKSNADVIAYVSCNPQTFARDAETLVHAGFVLEWVQPVDQFRWSPHIELVGAFRR